LLNALIIKNEITLHIKQRI